MFSAPPKRVAQENNFYYRTIEQRLANEIEGPANPAIQKIRDQEQISPADKEALCRYIAVMDSRVPEGKRRVRARFPKACRPVFDRFNEYLAAQSQRNPARREAIEVGREQVQHLWEAWAKDPPEDIWQYVVLSRQTSRSVQALNSMTWCFLLATGGHSFLTSDNPVFIFRDRGIGHEQSELTFPISSNVALFVSYSRDWPDGHYMQADAGVTREVNRRTARQASRYVFHCREAGWVVKLANKKSIKVRRIARLLQAG